MKSVASKVLVAIALISGAGAALVELEAVRFRARTDKLEALNPSGEIAPPSSETLTIVAFGDSKGRSAVFQAARDDALAHPPAVLVHLGDMVEQRSELEFRYARDLVARTREAHPELPIFVAIGNHEGFDRKDVHKTDLYEQSFGPTQMWFRTRGVLFVSLDTSNEKTLEEADAAAADAILAAERPRSRACVIVTHVPPFVSKPIFDKRSYRKQLDDAGSARILALVKKHDARLVLAGHFHGFADDAKDGTTFLVAGGGGATLDDAEGGFGYVRATLDTTGVWKWEKVPVPPFHSLERARYLVLRYEALLVAAGVLAGTLALLARAVIARRKPG